MDGDVTELRDGNSPRNGMDIYYLTKYDIRSNNDIH